MQLQIGYLLKKYCGFHLFPQWKIGSTIYHISEQFLMGAWGRVIKLISNVPQDFISNSSNCAVITNSDGFRRPCACNSNFLFSVHAYRIRLDWMETAAGNRNWRSLFSAKNEKHHFSILVDFFHPMCTAAAA